MVKLKVKYWCKLCTVGITVHLICNVGSKFHKTLITRARTIWLKRN